ncbi:type I restriction endonuclease subunit R [Candidatus Neomarinimicrobiota bacterium]
MIYADKTPDYIRLDEKNHVEEPFLLQLEELGWDIIRLDNKQKPKDTFREQFAEVIILPVLRDSLEKINPWLEEDQVEEVIHRITTYPGTSLLENNQYILKLLLEGTSVSENRQTGERSPNIHYIDYKDRLNNRFIAVSQFKARILGTEHHIYPDITLFLNGLPVVVVECKSPKVNEPILEAIDQLMRYSEQRGVSQEGSPRLFYPNQFIVATCRTWAKFGTITTHNEKYFYRWTDPYPYTLNDLEHGGTSPNDQQRLVSGMLDKHNLLDLIRTYTIFKPNERGQLIKVVARYQQFRAVKKAVKRLLEGQNKAQRGGIIWHTQGSGKSLTMMFMVREMYRHTQLCDWKVVFVTDRTQLEQQLSETSIGIGYTVKVADHIAELKQLLGSTSSDLVMAMIQKFQERDLREIFPELNASPHILVMTDEAHRTQYEMLRANLDRALPNATHIAYTGTPIEKTKMVFGDYIDKYTMRESIDDGVTLEIVYEGRTHNAEIPDQKAMDVDFADIFSDYRLEERLQILGFGSRDAYLEAKETIEAKAKDMVQHYIKHVFPNGFKAQVVTTSREAAVRYKHAIDSVLTEAIVQLEKDNPQFIDLDRLRNLQSGVVISGSHNDKPHIKEHTDPSKHEKIIQSFKLPLDGELHGVTGKVGIVIVKAMLITGFDAPYEQVMYLDQFIQAHNLLQAIARVNRIAEGPKDKGFIVDYIGVGHHLKEAIDIYDEEDQNDILGSMSTGEDEISELIHSHKEIMNYFKDNDLSDLSDYDAFFDLFYDEDIRFQYLILFEKLTKALNSVFPRKEALDFIQDYRRLAEINVMASKHLHDQRLGMKGIPEKLRRITDEHLKSKGIDQKVAPISIFDEEFNEHVATRTRTKTKAAEIEHAIRHHIYVHMDEDPELYASFAEAIEIILREFKDNWEEIYKRLEELRRRIRQSSKEPTYGLHRKKEMPFFRILKRELFEESELTEDQISVLVGLTKEIFEMIKTEISMRDFWESSPARNRLKGEIQKVLLSPNYIDQSNVRQNYRHIGSRLMELAENNKDIILFAA